MKSISSLILRSKLSILVFINLNQYKLFNHTIQKTQSSNSDLIVKSRDLDAKWYLTFICFALIIMLSRLYYVENFAIALPFWDQWDAEWAGLLKPWIEGNLQFSDLFAGHNEHRIFPTRLTTLAIFLITGTWNNLTEARLNIPLSAFTPLMLIWLICKHERISGPKWLVVAVILAGASLPFSWENILIGFQSQFYFLNLFTLCALALSVFHSDKYSGIAGTMFFCILSILTSASGLLTCMAVIVVYSLSSLLKGKLNPQSSSTISILLFMSFIAYYTMPVVEGHKILQAENALEFIKAVVRIMGWPLRGSQLHIGLMWLPSLITIPILILRRKIVDIDLLMIGCFVWTGMQIAALAYGRGHEILQLPSRYSDVLLLGLAGNSWFILRMPDTFGNSYWARRLLYILAAAFHCAIFINFIKRTKVDIKTLTDERERRVTQTMNVCGYLKTKNFIFLDKKGYQIPYPNGDILRQYLDDPQLQKVLIVDNCPIE